MFKNQSQFVDISTSAVLRIVFVLLGLIFLYLIRDILMIVFFAIIIAAAVSGPVGWLQKKKIPRILGVAFIYLIILLAVGLVASMVMPLLVDQVGHLAGQFPALMEKVGLSLQQWWGNYKINTNLQEILNQFSAKLGQATSNIFASAVSVFGGMFSAMVILVISFYLSLQERGIKDFVLSLTPEIHQPYVTSLIGRIQNKIGKWLRGLLLLMLIVGTLTYIGLSALGVKYALLLALVAGFLEIIPFIGPITSMILAAIITFAQLPFLAFLVLILYIVIQQFENYIVVPQVMKRAVGLNPITIIIAILIGAKLAGVLGIILSVPLTASLGEIFSDWKGSITS